MKFLEYLTEYIMHSEPYDYSFKAGDKVETFHGLKSRSNSIMFILNVSPEKWIKKPEVSGIYRVILTLKSHMGNLKYGHTGPDNLGIVKMEFPKEVEFTYGAPTVFGAVLDFSEIWTINGKELNGWTERLNYLLSLNPKFKIVVDYTKRKKIESYPPNIRKFINVYIGMGANRFGPTDHGYRKYRSDLDSIKFDQVKEYYQNNRDKFPPTPRKVYRGFNVADWGTPDSKPNPYSQKEIDKLTNELGTSFKKIKAGDTISYKHPFKYPISCSASVTVALDFASYDYVMHQAEKMKKYLGIVLEFSISPDDIVFDLRKTLSDHPAQGEVVLDPKKIYTVRVARVGKILNGKVVK